MNEAQQQQTATADVLKVISRSPGQLEPVFKAMLANGTRAYLRGQVRTCFFSLKEMHFVLLRCIGATPLVDY